MIFARRLFVFLAMVWLAAGWCAAQLFSQPADPQKAAAADRFADEFMQRLHASLDFAALPPLFVRDCAARHREYPGDFLRFDTPVMSKVMLNQTDDATLQRKLMADWNLEYLTSILLFANENPKLTTADKILPAQFVKAAKKSLYLKSLAGEAGQVTLVSATELNEYLAEADRWIAVLRREVQPQMLSSPAFRRATEQSGARFGPPRVTYDAMGFDAAYTVARDGLMLVMAEHNGEMRMVTLAPLHN